MKRPKTIKIAENLQKIMAGIVNEKNVLNEEMKRIQQKESDVLETLVTMAGVDPTSVSGSTFGEGGVLKMEYHPINKEENGQTKVFEPQIE